MSDDWIDFYAALDPAKTEGTADPMVTLDYYSLNQLKAAFEAGRSSEAVEQWRDPKDKPQNLPGEHHSEDVLIVMRDAWDKKLSCRIGHVSLGHWRPSGGNGNFDDAVFGWMPMPSTASLDVSEEKP